MKRIGINYVFLISSAVVIAINIALFGLTAWSGVPKSICLETTIITSIIGILIGAGMFKLMSRHIRPKWYTLVRWCVACGITAGVLTLAAEMLIGIATWGIAAQYCQSEMAYSALIFLSTIASSIFAIFFGAGLGQSWPSEDKHKANE